MDIVINLQPLFDFFSLPADQLLLRIMVLFGWIPIAIAFMWGASQIWLSYIRGQWDAKQKFILLAIDIPRGNEQTPMAVENFFAYLGGAHGTHNLIDHYWEGHFQLSFSFEIVSIEGYTQFLIYTPEKHRDLVESGIYSQYPDAEITEVEDYTKGMPTKFPDDEYDVFGWEFVQLLNPVYPIKTYKDFEHQMGASETQFKDPMASLMDMCSSLKKGEHFWYQLIVVPTGFSWPKEGEKEISKILGEDVKSEPNIFDKISDGILKLINDFSEAIYSLWGDIEDSKDSKDEGFKMLNLKPKEKRQIEAIQDKISKLGFEVKIRMVYIAKKEVMNTPKVAGGFVGFMKQFMYLDLNQLKPDLDMTSTRTAYFFKNSRLNKKKNNIVKAYIGRSDNIGRNPGILNIEELATLWHFPVEASVRAPLIQKSPGRKAGPPMSLPIGEEIVSEGSSRPVFMEDMENEVEEEQQSKKDIEEKKSNSIKELDISGENFNKKGNPPGNLPVA